MAVVRRRAVPTSKDNVKTEVEEVKVPVVETEVEEKVEEVKKPVTKKPVTKKVETKGETKVAKTTKKVEEKEEKKVAPAKKTTPAKKVVEEKKVAKSLDLTKKPVEEKTYEIGEFGTLKRDELIYMLKDRLANEVDEDGKLTYNIELAKLENASKVIKCLESILSEALEKSNIVHLCGRNFNRRKVKSRVYNPPIGNGAYLALPHYKMSYVLENSEVIKGKLNGEDFVAEDGTVYTREDLLAMDADFFGEE